MAEHARGWHQSAIDRAHESVATLKIDRAAAVQGAQDHLDSLTTQQTAAPETGG